MSDSLAILRTRHDSEEVELESTYRAEFVEALKAAVPHTDRRWNPETSLWTFKAFWLSRVTALVRDHYFEAYQEHTNEAGEVEKTDLIHDVKLGTQTSMFTTQPQQG